MQILTRSHDNTNTHGNGWKGWILFWVHLPDERDTSQGRKEGQKTRRKERKKDRRKEGRRTREKAREKEQLLREREKALDSIRPETNNSVLSWINTRISFLLPVYARSWQHIYFKLSPILPYLFYAGHLKTECNIGKYC